MPAYLLAWNPKRWHWNDINEYSKNSRRGIKQQIRWSSGNSKRIIRGDRVFIIRLGLEPKGIFASGTVVTDVFEALHWDPERKAIGDTASYIYLELDTFLNPEEDEILTRDLLLQQPFSDMHWDTQMSGVRIPDHVADALEEVWKSFRLVERNFLPEEIIEEENLFEGAKQRITINAYERNPEARRLCLENYGYSCVICGFNFQETYGLEGEGLIHVHHLRQLADIGEEYRIDPINDLRPVCPNCHAMVHRRNPPYSIEEVKTLLERK